MLVKQSPAQATLGTVVSQAPQIHHGLEWIWFFSGLTRERTTRRGKNGELTYIMARLTSLVGMTPSFSPSMGSEKRAKASLISASSCAVMSCSLASLDGRGAAAAMFAPPPDDSVAAILRLAGCLNTS